MKNIGKWAYRLDHSETEQMFAEAWDEINTDHKRKLNGKGMLDYLLAEDTISPNGEVSDRDREVAATVIQWLGSPIGQDFLLQLT
uniref:Uncharacterized protein n=1 Tax=viral metagenome TaxID=1070528 RepID=A0A6H2A6J4_9ZZZZ